MKSENVRDERRLPTNLKMFMRLAGCLDRFAVDYKRVTADSIRLRTNKYIRVLPTH